MLVEVKAGQSKGTIGEAGPGSRVSWNEDAARPVFPRKDPIVAQVHVAILRRHALEIFGHDHRDRSGMKQLAAVGQRVDLIDGSAILVVAAGLRVPAVGMTA